MLYRKKEEPKLSEALFQNPTSEYRGTRSGPGIAR